jgi:hypothetical protein
LQQCLGKDSCKKANFISSTKKKNTKTVKVGEGDVLTQDQVAKYFEVRLRSLAIMAVLVAILCIFLSFLFVWRGQYLYAAIMIGLAIIVALAAARLPEYARLFRRSKGSDS